MVRTSSWKEDLEAVAQVMRKSPYALRSVEIANKAGLPLRRAQAALQRLQKEGRARWRPRFIGRLHYHRLWRLHEQSAAPTDQDSTAGPAV